MQITKHTEKIIYIILLTFLLIPFVSSILLATPVPDDFSMATGTNNNIFFNALKEGIRMYNAWGGTFIYWVVEKICNPLVYTSNTKIYGITMTVIFLLFILVFIVSFSMIIKKYITGHETVSGIISLVMLSLILCGRGYYEVFYWFVGSSYLWAISASLLYVYFAIKYFYYEKKPRILFGMVIFGGISCNFTNTIVPIGVFYFMLLTDAIRNKTAKKSEVLLMIYLVAVGCLTVFAPGNFSRYNVGNEDKSLHLGKALINTGIVIYKNLFDHLRRPVTMTGFVILFFLGAYLYAKGKEETRINIFRVVFLCVISLLGVIYPTCLGYDNALVENRTVFIISFIIDIYCGFIALYLGNYLSKKSIAATKIFSGVIVFFLSLLIFMPFEKHNAHMDIITKWDVIKEQNAAICDILKQIETTPGDEIIIEAKRYPKSGVLCDIHLKDDVNHKYFERNIQVASYYGKKSVLVKWID